LLLDIVFTNQLMKVFCKTLFFTFQIIVFFFKFGKLADELFEISGVGGLQAFLFFDSFKFL